jgi:hypothetical protein
MARGVMREIFSRSNLPAPNFHRKPRCRSRARYFQRFQAYGSATLCAPFCDTGVVASIW